MESNRRGGRKEIILPSDGEAGPEPRRPLVLALARAYRWQRMIENGEVSGIETIAAQQGVDRAYISRILRLGCLSPTLVDTALQGRDPRKMSLAKLHRSLPLRSDEQDSALG